ncbi:peptidase C15, pyroglutamyl peptidase I-like protein [Calocera cornea HHB12733]|uniref:Peptidase C15, pyroglutamyl peptidase I-like protein n=1 Tax=Calocera cornea HHB12733 TaxID=1353952 RepID=A0A165ITG2_9BASI|nr:peptidase C15, pyroglutamyl peptidase I-like protein [Calocera cornea HHB12733]
MAPIDLSPSKKPYNVLVTGFGPFGDYEHNPSWLGVQPLSNTVLPTPTHNISFTCFRVPTSYAAILRLIPGVHARPPRLPATHDPAPQPLPEAPEGGYDLVIHVGAGMPGALALEAQGHKTGYRIPDWEGELPPVRGFGVGYEGFDEILKTQGNVPGLVEYMKICGFTNSRVSTDAGHYCCDFIYYCSLAESVRRGAGKGSKVQFMHIPPPGKPYGLEAVTEAVKCIAMFYSMEG